MSWWDQLWRRKAEDWIFAWLDDAQVGGEATAGEVTPDAAYLSVFLKSARVVDVRKGLTRFYGAVHSIIRLPHRSQGCAEFNVVTTPQALRNVDPAIDRVVQFDQRLLGPVPYVGGDLEMEIGLFSVASSDLAAPYLALLESLSRTAGVSFVSAALPFAGPILEGVKLLSGSDRALALEVGVSTTQSRPRAGHCVVIRAPKSSLDPARLRVDRSDFRLLFDGKPLAAYPYMVLQIRAEPRRDDWARIPDVAEAFRAVQDEYRRGSTTRTAEALQYFRRVVRTSNDLLLDDAERLVDKVDSMYLEAGEPEPARRGVAARPARTLPDLDAVALYDT